MSKHWTDTKTATTWRWAKARAENVLSRVAPMAPCLRPLQCDAFIVTNDPRKIASANLRQWWVSAHLRSMPGTPLYTAASVLNYSLRTAHKALRDARSALHDVPKIVPSDIRAAAKMLRHILGLVSADLPVDLLVVTCRLHCSSGAAMDPNDDWSHDGTEVQIIVQNPQRIMSLVVSALASRGIIASPAKPGYCGLYSRIPNSGVLQSDRGEWFRFEENYWHDGSGAGWSANQLVWKRASAVRRSVASTQPSGPAAESE